MSADPLGWCPFAERIETQVGDYDDIPDDGMLCDAVISHVAGGFIGGLIAMAKDPNTPVSWHFSIGRDGRILQHRSIADPAWHAGIVNQPTWKLYNNTNPNRHSVGIEHEGFSIPATYADYVYSASDPWPEPLIASSIKVHDWVFQTVNAWYPGRMAPGPDTVITHSMTDARTRSQDPGDLWLATVRPRIIAALQGVPAPVVQAQPSEYDRGYEDGKKVGFQDGRGEMREAWEREDTRIAGEWIAYVRTRREAWQTNR